MFSKKPKLFYLLDEHTDSSRFCERLGMVPCEFTSQGLVTKYKWGEYVYSAFEGMDCYSGFAVTLMREPVLPFMELLHVALTSRREEDRIGALGVILKRYPDEFKCYLRDLLAAKTDCSKAQKRMLKEVTVTIKENSYFAYKNLPEVFDLCAKIIQQNE